MTFKQLSVDQVVIMERRYWKDPKITAMPHSGGILLQGVGWRRYQKVIGALRTQGKGQEKHGKE